MGHFPLYDVRQAAELLGFSEARLRMMHKRGNGPRATRIGRRVMFTPRSLEAFATNGSTGDPDEPN